MRAVVADPHSGRRNFCIFWNAENQLTRVDKDGLEVARFEYDPLGRRTKKLAGATTATWTYDGEDMLAEETAIGGTTTSWQYIQGAGIDEPLARKNVTPGATGDLWEHYSADGLGSVLTITNGVGAVVHSYTYDSWGGIQAGVARGGYAYTGREWDPETGLYYYRARYYEPKLGSFISEDSVDFRDGKTRYGYVMGNPVGLVDPSGHAAQGGGRNCAPNVPRCGGNCPHWVFTLFFNICREESNNPDVWIRRCMQKKCRLEKKEVMITCDSSACQGGPPAYTPCSDSIVVCPNNRIPEGDKNNPPCWRRVLAHEMVVHSCRPGGPEVPDHSLTDVPSTRLRNGISCP